MDTGQNECLGQYITMIIKDNNGNETITIHQYKNANDYNIHKNNKLCVYIY